MWGVDSRCFWQWPRKGAIEFVPLSARVPFWQDQFYMFGHSWVFIWWSAGQLQAQYFVPRMEKPGMLSNPNFLSWAYFQILLKFSQFKAKTGIFWKPENRYTWELLAKKEVESVTWWKGFYSETMLPKINSALSVAPFTSSANFF